MPPWCGAYAHRNRPFDTSEFLLPVRVAISNTLHLYYTFRFLSFCNILLIYSYSMWFLSLLLLPFCMFFLRSFMACSSVLASLFILSCNFSIELFFNQFHFLSLFPSTFSFFTCAYFYSFLSVPPFTFSFFTCAYFYCFLSVPSSNFQDIS